MNKKQIKKNNPEVFKQPHIQELMEQSTKLHDLKALADTNGGKELIRLLVRDTINTLHSLRSTYRDSSREELVAMIATMSAHYDVARMLIKAEENEKEAEEMLDEQLSAELME